MMAEYANIVIWRNQLKGQPFYTQCYKDYGEALQRLMAKTE